MSQVSTAHSDANAPTTQEERAYLANRLADRQRRAGLDRGENFAGHRR